MSLLATVRDGVATAFEQSGDLIESVIISRTVTGAYNPATGTHATDPALVTQFTVGALPDKYDASDVDGVNYQRGDARLFVQVAECSFEPTSDHKATFRGATWGIESVANHVQALYEIQLRRPL